MPESRLERIARHLGYKAGYQFSRLFVEWGPDEAEAFSPKESAREKLLEAGATPGLELENLLARFVAAYSEAISWEDPSVPAVGVVPDPSVEF